MVLKQEISITCFQSCGLNKMIISLLVAGFVPYDLRGLLCKMLLQSCLMFLLNIIGKATFLKYPNGVETYRIVEFLPFGWFEMRN